MGQASGQAGSEWLISAQHREYLAAFRDNYSPVHVPVIAQHFSVIKATRGTALSFNPIAGHPPIDNPKSSTTYFVTWSPNTRLERRLTARYVFPYRRRGEVGVLLPWCFMEMMLKHQSAQVTCWDDCYTAVEMESSSIFISSKYCMWMCEAVSKQAQRGTVFYW